MASNVDVTTATWGTTSLKKSTGEIYDQTAQNQIADNTGVCFYAPRMLSITEDTITSGDPLVSHSNYGYMGAGTYQVYGIMDCTINLDPGANGTALLTVGGTSIISFTTTTSGGFGTVLSADAEVVRSADGWVTVTYSLDPTSTGTMTMSKGNVAIRRTG